MGWLGTGEILIILFLAIILFGPKKLPELGKVIGSGLREIRKYSRMALDDDEKEPVSNLPEKLTSSPDIVSENFDESEYPGNMEKDKGDAKPGKENGQPEEPVEQSDDLEKKDSPVSDEKKT